MGQEAVREGLCKGRTAAEPPNRVGQGAVDAVILQADHQELSLGLAGVHAIHQGGDSGFDRLDELGQTFYFSSTLSEDVDSPTLRLEATISSVAVFLDGALLYTDCPELNNHIGDLRLPMLEWYREEPVLVTLPQNYQGNILTIAQSTDPSGGELAEPSTTVWPCAVTLYCGYAYESALVAESFQTAVPAALAFAAGMLLLALFLWQAF